jgi:hypothetical protein
MAITTASLITLSSAVTAASGATAKVAALLPGLHDAIVNEVSQNYPVTPSQQSRLAQVRAELVANAAEYQTALGL